MNTFWRVHVAGLIVVLFFHSALAHGGERPSNFDIRERRGRVKPTDEQEKGIAELQKEKPGVKIALDAGTGTPRSISSVHGFLTDADPQFVVALNRPSVAQQLDRHAPVKRFLQTHAAVFGHSDEVLTKSRIKRDFVTEHNGLRTVVWEQELDDIPIFNGVMIGHITQRGELVSISSLMVPSAEQAADRGNPNRRALQANPPVSAAQAVTLASANTGTAVPDLEIEQDGASAGTNEGDARRAIARKRKTLRSSVFRSPAEAKLVWFPLERATLRLAWEVIFISKDNPEAYRVVVDAESGEVLARLSLVENATPATYRVWTSDSPSPFSPGHSAPSTDQPPLVPRVLTNIVALSTNASPSGWIPDGTGTTIGNNVDARLSWETFSSPLAYATNGFLRPTNTGRVFDFPWDAESDPTVYWEMSTVQLFYWCNWMHDRLYALGFTEAAGNFQHDNFGRGGIGGDAVVAESQWGYFSGAANNAFFAVPPDDGSSTFNPWLTASLFNWPFPPRDPSLDAEIILHEYTHGLSNRRVGGGVGLSSTVSRGLGEGWSDFYALALLSESGDAINGNYAAGAYSSYFLLGDLDFNYYNYYFGTRRYPYSIVLTNNPLTLKDIDPTRCDLHTDVPSNPIYFNAPSLALEVHNMGEVWCVALWEARANLIAKYGFAIGNELILQLVTDAMNLTPPNPTFVEARDAILQADRIKSGGANGEELWRAFAKRGLGYSAQTPDQLVTFDTVEAFDLPDEYVLARRILAAGADSTAEVNTNGTVSTWGNNSLGQLGGGFISTNRTTPGTVTNLTGVISIAGGAYHYLALKGDGTVWSWGQNSSGQLGDATITTRSSPVRVQGISNVVRIAAGQAFSLAMRADGTVWSWGDNSFGQLGSGTTVSRAVPAQVTNLTDVADIVGGGWHSIALRTDGSLSVWGRNEFGQLGDGMTSNRTSPILISSVAPVMSVGAGQSHTLVARNDGTVWTWGLNASGQLGDGTTNNHPSPILITNLMDVVSVDGGSNHSVALTVGGVVWAWGGNQFGQIGNGTNSTAYLPVALENPEFAIAVQAGASHTVALLRNGSTVSWGNNSSGQLGDGTTTERWSPVATLAGQNASSETLTYESSKIAAGSEFTVVLNSDASVWTWGRNDVGQLGDGTTIPKIVPRQIGGLDSVLEVRAGSAHVLALRNDGSVWAWGANDQGQLGDGTSSNRFTPIQVPGMTGVRAVSTRDRHSVALKANGTVWAWGKNNDGQLGDGTHNKRLRPVQVAGLSNIVAVAAGSGHTLALDSKGAVWAWGNNGDGQLGDNTTKTRLTPIRVPNLTNASAIAAGFDHSMALRSNSTVVLWGNNNHGQIGDNSIIDRRQPVQALTLTNIATISAGADYSLAREAFGRVWSWGDNGRGQLGLGTTADNYFPVQISSIEHATHAVGGLNHTVILLADGTLLESGGNLFGQLGIGTLRGQWSPVTVQRPANVAGGSSHTVAVKRDGTVWTMGLNSSGQLGDGTTGDRFQPTLVNGLLGIINVRAGQSHTLAVHEDGTVWAWGSNSSGELGDGSTTASSSPIHVSGLNGIVAVAAGGNHSLALKYDGSVWAWGANADGQLGDGTTSPRLTPVQVSNLTAAVEIAAGSAHSYALKNDGTVRSWGNNAWGQLGNGTTTPATVPIQVTSVSNVWTIASGANFGLAAASNGPVYAWGDNFYGQLGDNSTNGAVTAVQVSGLSNAVALAAGFGHSAALTLDGVTHAWGQNQFGQLGDGTVASSSIPVLVTNGGMGFALAAGSNHTILTKSDGHIWTFGGNGTGQLGINSTNDSVIPMIVNGAMAGAELNLSGVALRRDRTLWSWGYGVGGALGDGTYASRPTAGMVLISDVQDVAAGSTFFADHGGYFLAAKTDGTVWAWGDDQFGQIGVGIVESLPPHPVQVPGLSNITSVAANGTMSFALQDDQTVWAWGYNDAGNLGLGNRISQFSPVHVGINNVAAIAAGSFFSAILKTDGTVWTAGINFFSALGHTNTEDGFRSLIHRQVPGLSNVIAIDCGNFHTLALKDDGTLWSWGFGGYLGTGSTIDSLQPVQISALSNIVIFTANSGNSQAMDASNAVWSWGFNVGDGSSGYQLTPVPLAISGKVKGFGSATQDNATFWKEDGSIWSFGSNDYMQIGDGTDTPRLTPVLSGGGMYFNIFQ